MLILQYVMPDREEESCQVDKLIGEFAQLYKGIVNIQVSLYVS